MKNPINHFNIAATSPLRKGILEHLSEMSQGSYSITLSLKRCRYAGIKGFVWYSLSLGWLLGHLLRNTLMSLTISSHILIGRLATGSFSTHCETQNFSDYKPVTDTRRYSALRAGECCSNLNITRS